MKRILVVDDEEGIGLSLRRAMRSRAPDIKVLLAPHGAAAVALLQTQRVSLVVTDLLMPVMDGFELLAWLSQNQPTTPAIAMTGVRGDHLQARVSNLGAGLLVEKPFDVGALIDKIREVLAAAARGLIEGMGLGTFVQMIGMEGKTCTLRVAAGGRTGALYFSCGELMTAETEGARGEEAALDVLGWDGATIEVVPSCRELRRELQRPLGHLLMEAFRLKDERARDAGGAAPLARELVGKPALRQGSATTLQEQLRALREVGGFRGAALMGFTGEVLVADVVDATLDFPAVCAAGSELFRQLHRGGKPAQVDLCEELVVRSGQAILLLRCSAPTSRAHFHLLAMLDPQGNQALAKVKLEALVPRIVERLA
jgi:CheY-like chemotaxis protein